MLVRTLIQSLLFAAIFAAGDVPEVNAGARSVDQDGQGDTDKRNENADTSAQQNDHWDDESDDTWDDDWDDDWGEDWDDDWEADTPGWRWTGFVEGAIGIRLGDSHPVAGDLSLGEARLRLETDHQADHWRLTFKGEGLYDEVREEAQAIIRELAVSASPLGKLDLRLGRQVLTWGTGDLLFLNDLFPKDFESFFAGREDEYLKAPSDAIRLTGYSDWINADLVYAPEFEPDVYLDGERFSFFSPAAGMIVVPEPPLPALSPDSDEWALRLFRTHAGVEYAAYFYDGFFKQPTASTSAGVPTYAPLRAAGASVRWPGLGGLFNVETSYYDSRNDPRGDDPATPNSQFRLLLGHERELVRNLNLGVQYYVEHVVDHAALIAASPTPDFEPEAWRHLLTTRLTYRSHRDRVTWSLFTFASMDEGDWHLRPEVNWRFSDQWQFTGGARLFGGDAHTFFGQLQDNDSIFLRVRRYF